MTVAPDNLSSTLQQLVDDACRHLRFRRARSALLSAFVVALPVLLVPALMFLILRLASTTGDPLVELTHPTVLWTAMLYPLAIVVWVVERSVAGISRTEALALFDRRLELEDRLVTAEEFLARSDRTRFMEAAIEDAVFCARRARDTRLDVHVGGRRARARDLLWPVAAALLLVLGNLAAPAVETIDVTDDRQVVQGEIDSRTEPRTEEPPAQSSEKRPASPAAEESESTGGGEPRPSVADDQADSLQARREASSRTRSGESSNAGDSVGAAQAAGAPAVGGEPANAKKKESPEETSRGKKKNGPEKEEEATERKPSQSSGTTASRGAKGGSAKNPVTSQWSTTDKVPSSDEESESEDEEVDDETEVDESRGGMQPNLRDRRPPASRDLSIGQDGQDPGDGRGGPSPRKKSRGTASLVLGIPIPDQVKGQLNPGTIKITREQVQPEAEEATSVAATARAPRSGELGFVPELQHEPWLDRLIRSYFLEVREKNGAGPDPINDNSSTEKQDG